MRHEETRQVPVPVPEPHAVLPLTAFDRLYERTTFVIGWLVEGDIDIAALEGALTRVTRKWRILSGRMELLKTNKVYTIFRPAICAVFFVADVVLCTRKANGD